MDDATRIDEMDFQIRRAGDFIEIENRFGKTTERIQRAPLQKFGHSALKGDFEARMRSETGVAALVGRVQQHDAEDGISWRHDGI